MGTVLSYILILLLLPLAVLAIKLDERRRERKWKEVDRHTLSYTISFGEPYTIIKEKHEETSAERIVVIGLVTQNKRTVMTSALGIGCWMKVIEDRANLLAKQNQTGTATL
jgi:hypothetical protein